MKKLQKLVLPPVDSKDLIILANLGLVHRIAQKYKQFCNNTSVTYDDLVQEGTIGLMNARDKFDPNNGARFSTYANFWIKARILRILDRYYSTIHVTFSATAEYNKLVKKYGSANGVRGSLIQSMDALIDKITVDYHKNKISVDDYHKFVDILQARSPMNYTHISIDTVHSGSEFDENTSHDDMDGEHLGLDLYKRFHTIESIDGIVSRKSTSQKLMSILTNEEVKMVQLYFGYNGQPHTYKELAVICGCSKQQAHQKLRYAIKKMHDYAQDYICYEDGIDMKELLNGN